MNIHYFISTFFISTFTPTNLLAISLSSRSIRTLAVLLGATLLITQQITIPAVADVSPSSGLTSSGITSNKAHLNRQGELVDLSQLFPDFQARCFYLNTVRATNALTSPFTQLLALLELDPLGLHLLNTATELNPAICLENRLDGTHGYYDYKYNAIVLQESIGIHQRSITLVHELRHLEQVIEHYGVTTEYDMDETARVRFAVEADAQAMTTLFAWRIRDKEFEWAWNALTELEQYRDITETFEKEMYRSDSEEKALLVAFRQWYHSDWRVNAYYMNAKSQYLDILDETKKIRQYKTLPAGYFDQLCKLPDGKNYRCSFSKEIEKNPRSITLNEATSGIENSLPFSNSP